MPPRRCSPSPAPASPTWRRSCPGSSPPRAMFLFPTAVQMVRGLRASPGGWGWGRCTGGWRGQPSPSALNFPHCRSRGRVGLPDGVRGGRGTRLLAGRRGLSGGREPQHCLRDGESGRPGPPTRWGDPADCAGVPGCVTRAGSPLSLQEEGKSILRHRSCLPQKPPRSADA